MGRIFGKPQPCGRLGVRSGFCLAIALLLGAGPAPSSISIEGIPPSGAFNPESLLEREIIRQAFLLAAREELGLTIRDPSLGDSADAGGVALEIESYGLPTPNKAVRLRRKDDADQAILWEKTYAYPPGYEGQTPLLSLVEADSRAVFPGILKKAGCAPGPLAVARAEAVVPEATARKLEEMSIASQFAALRELHALLRASRSPALEGALVRGYANLSLLSSHHFAPGTDVFKARSLLYAERMVAADPKSPWGLWHRAYARCLGGLHAEAEEDLAAADLLVKRAPKAEGPLWTSPAWVPLVAASFRFEPDPLFAAAKDEHVRELALLLRFVAVEEPGASQLTLRAGREALSGRPECFRIFDGMFEVGGVGDRRASTEVVWAVSQASLRDGLDAVSDLPEALKAVVDDEQKDDQAVIDALVGTEGGEPSFAAYAKLHREERFVEAWRRLILLRNTLGVPTEEFLQECLPEFEAHPFQPFLALYGAPNSGIIAVALPRIIAAMKAHVLDFRLARYQPLAAEIARYDAAAGKELFNKMRAYAGRVYEDRKADVQIISGGNKYDVGDSIRRVSPHAPAAFVETIIRLDDNAEGRANATKWEKEFASQPLILSHLGRRYALWKDWENSRRLFKAAIKLSPDASAFLNLADAYKDAGDLDGWKKTLDDYLAQEPDGGLGQAQVRVKIARDFMSRGEWEKAQPYAEAAAESFAQFAMQCAIDCYVGMEDWDRAEVWVIRETQRYGPVNNWYYWCLRTGHGHFVQARNTLNSGIPQGRLTLGQMGEFTEFDGSKREAFDFFQREYAARGDVGEGASFVALADDVDEIEARDRALTLMIARGDPAKNPVYQVQLALFAKLLQDTLAKGEKTLFDEAAFQAVVDSARPEQRPVILYYGGRFAEKRGYPEKALAIYKRSLAFNNLDAYLATSATLDVRRLEKSSAPTTPAAKTKSAKDVQEKAPAKSKTPTRTRKAENAPDPADSGEPPRY